MSYKKDYDPDYTGSYIPVARDGKTYLGETELDSVNFIDTPVMADTHPSDTWAEVWEQDVTLPDGEKGKAIFNFRDSFDKNFDDALTYIKEL